MLAPSPLHVEATQSLIDQLDGLLTVAEQMARKKAPKLAFEIGLCRLDMLNFVHATLKPGDDL